MITYTRKILDIWQLVHFFLQYNNDFNLCTFLTFWLEDLQGIESLSEEMTWWTGTRVLFLLLCVSPHCGLVAWLQTVFCLLRFHLHNTNHDTKLPRKMWGSEICFNNNKGLMYVTVKCGSQSLESVFITCNPFYSLWEFALIILLGVCIFHLRLADTRLNST